MPLKHDKSAHRIAIENLLNETKRYLHPSDIATMTGATPVQVKNTLSVLRKSGQEILDSIPCTDGERGNLYRLIPFDATAKKQPKPLRAGTTRGDYDGAELRPYEGRPGAMDAFYLPSMVNGERVARVAPRLLCVGKAGPAALQPSGQQRFAK